MSEKNKPAFTGIECEHEDMEVHVHAYGKELELDMECPDCQGTNMYYITMGEKLSNIAFELTDCEEICFHCGHMEHFCECHTCRFCGESGELVSEDYCDHCLNEEDEEE